MNNKTKYESYVLVKHILINSLINSLIKNHLRNKNAISNFCFDLTDTMIILDIFRHQHEFSMQT